MYLLFDVNLCISILGRLLKLEENSYVYSHVWPCAWKYKHIFNFRKFTLLLLFEYTPTMVYDRWLFTVCVWYTVVSWLLLQTALPPPLFIHATHRIILSNNDDNNTMLLLVLFFLALIFLFMSTVDRSNKEINNFN